MPRAARLVDESFCVAIGGFGGDIEFFADVVATMSEREVFPSAAFQMSVAVSLRLKSVESVADMIIISPAISRAATDLLRITWRFGHRINSQAR